jgi:hypothetical protein
MSTLVTIHRSGELVWTLVKGELVAWRVEDNGMSAIEKTEQALNAEENGLSTFGLSPKPIGEDERVLTIEERILLERYRIWRHNTVAPSIEADSNVRRFINSMMETG